MLSALLTYLALATLTTVHSYGYTDPNTYLIWQPQWRHWLVQWLK